MAKMSPLPGGVASGSSKAFVEPIGEAHKAKMNAIRPVQPGLFVVSLDFELAWGIRHLPWMHSYMPNLIGARSAVRSLLTTFKEYEIHATWAVVGFPIRR